MTPPNTTTVPALLYGQPIPPAVWEAIRAEFGLPSDTQVRTRLEQLKPDPERVMRKIVRVFIGAETLCPGYQFTDSLEVQPAVQILFARAMELKIAHNYFSAWMVAPSPDLEGRRPSDLIHNPAPPLLRALASFRSSQTVTGPVRARLNGWN